MLRRSLSSAHPRRLGVSPSCSSAVYPLQTCFPWISSASAELPVRLIHAAVRMQRCLCLHQEHPSARKILWLATKKRRKLCLPSEFCRGYQRAPSSSDPPASAAVGGRTGGGERWGNLRPEPSRTAYILGDNEMVGARSGI